MRITKEIEDKMTKHGQKRAIRQEAMQYNDSTKEATKKIYRLKE